MFVFFEKIVAIYKSIFCVVTEFVCLYFNNKQKRNSKSSFFVIPKQSFVIPKRFERLTHALEGRCSIQLSYGTDLFN